MGVPRQRFVYRTNEKGEAVAVPVEPDYVGERPGHHTSEGELYDGLRTTDGVDISSRKKRREYMKSTGTTDPSDFASGYQRRKEQERARFFTGQTDASQGARKLTIARVMEQLSRGARR